MEIATALYFGGYSSQVMIADTALVDAIDTRNFTFEAWVKGIEAEQPEHPQIMSNRPNGFLFGFHSRWRGSAHKMPYIQLGAFNGLYEPFRVPHVLDGTWRHFAATREGMTVSYYLDGHFYRSVSHGCLTSSTRGNVLYLGRDRPVSRTTGFRGYLAEVRIWNVVRGESDIRAGMNTLMTGAEAGLIHYWPLSEGEGHIAHDLAANESIGIIEGDAVWRITDFPNRLMANRQVFSSRYEDLRTRARAAYELHQERRTERELWDHPRGRITSAFPIVSRNAAIKKLAICEHCRYYARSSY
nr:LamG domain-containing protein [Leptolyngbyaceae cyanobacterium MO_188.B28]